MSSSAGCEENINNISNFYLSNSLMCPGLEREKHCSNQYILTTPREAHAMYNIENPGDYICFSKLT